MNTADSYVEEFLGNIDTNKAFGLRRGEAEKIFEPKFPEQPTAFEDLLTVMRKHMDTEGINPASGGHLGYIPGGGIWYSALGDYLADVTNKYAGVFFGSPGAAMMENTMVEWMARMFDFPETAGGTLTSGGSIANLAAIVTARDKHGITSAKVPNAVIYLTRQVHHCIDKAIRIAGLAECQVRYIQMDARYRMDVDDLSRQVAKDKEAGLTPWLVVTSAGTTDTGSVDPTDKVASVCKQNDMWLHVDAAYGGFFLLCQEGKEVLKGLHLADSIVVDPHKGLFLPYGTGAVIVRDAKDLYKSHYYQANYMQDAISATEYSPADLSPELTRHFRGMRMWLPLKLLGLKPFVAALSEKIQLARYFYDKIQEIPGMEVTDYPELSVVPWRYVPENDDANEFNLELIHEIHKDGRVFLSSTKLDDVVWLRVAILCFRTHLSTVDLCLQMITDCLDRVKLRRTNGS